MAVSAALKVSAATDFPLTRLNVLVINVLIFMNH